VADNSYDGFYPSVHTTFSLRDNLLLRLACAKTFGRPDFNNIIPNTTINENQSPGAPPDATGSINVVNNGLQPYAAKNYDLSLEYYFPQGGLASVGAFRKDLTNFFGALVTPATPELLSDLGLDERYVGWDVRTTINVAGAARVTGLEFNYVQPLTGLTSWGKYFNFTANTTKLHLQGPRATDFSGFIQRSGNIGITFSKNPVVFMLKWNYRGNQRLNAIGDMPNGFEYFAARPTLDLNGEYQITRHITAFANVRNLFNEPSIRVRKSGETPAYAHGRRLQDYGAQWAFGVKGSF
ncbi:MAG: TonB-dependent receptor domain-containing protein, partial [Opitutaceae bacterium]